MEHGEANGAVARTAETLPHSRAEAVAEALAYEFLKNGNYSASSGPVELKVSVSAAAAVVEDEMRTEFRGAPEFGGLVVQSVGFEDGVEDPKVHIYPTRASARLGLEPISVGRGPCRRQNAVGWVDPGKAWGNPSFP